MDDCKNIRLATTCGLEMDAQGWSCSVVSRRTDEVARNESPFWVRPSAVRRKHLFTGTYFQLDVRFSSPVLSGGHLRGRVFLVFLFELAATRLALPQSWISQGPGPSLNGQTEGIGDNPVAGAIDAIALGANPSILYVGTVNGGVWKTTNATFPRPSWIPLTDLKLPALSINSLAISPTDGNTLFVGTGSTSAFSCQGSPGIGVAKSTDGGNTWNVLAVDTFAGKAINSIVPTSISGGQVVLAATADKQGGVYRSADGGKTFVRISGAQGSGLPDAGVSSLIADPGNSNRFYAAVPSGYPKSTSDPCLSPFQSSREGPGIYVSIDGGVTWKLASSGIPADSLQR